MLNKTTNTTQYYSTSSSCHQHEFILKFSKANVAHTTDGVTKGGHRLAQEVKDWIQEQEEERDTTLTLSLIGNSLGGLYSRHAAARLLGKDSLARLPPILPLVFATTSSPHLGVSNETFVPLQRWIEELVGHALAQTGRDLFWIPEEQTEGEKIVGSVSVIQEMCSQKQYLTALERFQKRIAVANAYNTDFLVSVSSGGFLSKDSHSVHYTLKEEEDTNTNLLHNEHVVVQVTTPKEEDDIMASQSTTTTTKSCVEALDNLGWHKIFLDTRGALPSWLNFDAPPIPKQSTYSSQELQQHMSRYGTLFPVAHPLNMANSKTDWYGVLTQQGRPIMDALADLLIRDMVELSEAKAGNNPRKRKRSSEQQETQQPPKEESSEEPPPQKEPLQQPEEEEEESGSPPKGDQNHKNNNGNEDESSSSSSWEDIPSDGDESDSGYHTAREDNDDDDDPLPQQHHEEL